MRVRLAICVALIAAAFSAHAFTWGVRTKITGIAVYSANFAFITTENNQNPDNCPSGSQYLTIDQTSPNFRALYATAMAAYMQGQTVSVLYDGCLGGLPAHQQYCDAWHLVRDLQRLDLLVF